MVLCYSILFIIYSFQHLFSIVRLIYLFNQFIFLVHTFFYIHG